MAPWRRKVVRTLEFTLLLTGLGCVGSYLWLWSDATLYQLSATREMAQLAALRVPERATVRSAAASLPAGRDSLVGILEVPRVGLSVAVVEGDDDRALAV